MKAERLTDSISYHGEGPVWWPSGRLRFVDMLHGAIITLDGDRPTRTPVGSPVASVIRPRVGGGAIVATESGIALACEADLSDLSEAVRLFDDPRLRTNEGNCDPQGRFYVGTMAYDRTPGAASVYRWDGADHRPETVIAEVSTSNGLGWSPDGALAYYNDTPTGEVAVFDYTPDAGLRNRRSLTSIDEEAGRPDGLCVDAEGGVWVALNKGSAVHRYAPDGTLSERIEVPVRQVTACTLGGDSLDRLFITTSRENLAEDEEPAAGSIFVADVGVRGLAALPFAG